jgi:phage tail-like protein
MPVLEPYFANEFVVEIASKESPTVSKVTGLSLGKADPVDIPESGTNVVHKVSSGVVKFESLTLERYMDGSEDDRRFKEFFEQMFKISGQGGTPARGLGSSQAVRRDGAIVKKHYGQEVFRVAFYGAWVSQMKIGDLDAGSTTPLKQTITLEHDGLEWIQ